MKAACIKEMTSGNGKRYIIGAHSYSATAIEPALYLVATPIGNLSDITLRVLDVLAGADLLACEDTRVTRVLLERYAIRQKPVAYHDHNAAEAGPRLLGALQEGKSVALVSDAGTPLISDPGFRLVEEARGADIRIVPVPGPSAVLTALIATGLPTDSFFFAGFLAARRNARRKRLEALRAMDTTLVFYESPHRIAETLVDMAEIFGENRPAALCRELTKTFETIHTATLAALSATCNRQSCPRGEIVLVIGPAKHHAPAFDTEEADRILLEFAQDMSAARAACEAARITGQKKQTLYARIVALKAKQHG